MNPYMKILLPLTVAIVIQSGTLFATTVNISSQDTLFNDTTDSAGNKLAQGDAVVAIGYFTGADYDKAKAEKLHIFRKFQPGDSMAV